MNQSCLSRAKVRVNSRTTDRWGKLSCLKLSPPVREVQQEEKVPGPEGGLWGPREFKSMYVLVARLLTVRSQWHLLRHMLGL